MELPTEYRQSGVRIGDVGIVLRSGAFDFLFNILLPANHEINRGRVPETFHHLNFSDVNRKTYKCIIYGRNSYLASSSLHKTSNGDPSYVLKVT